MNEQTKKKTVSDRFQFGFKQLGGKIMYFNELHKHYLELFYLKWLYSSTVPFSISMEFHFIFRNPMNCSKFCERKKIQQIARFSFRFQFDAMLFWSIVINSWNCCTKQRRNSNGICEKNVHWREWWPKSQSKELTVSLVGMVWDKYWMFARLNDCRMCGAFNDSSIAHSHTHRRALFIQCESIEAVSSVRWHCLHSRNQTIFSRLSQ